MATVMYGFLQHIIYLYIFRCRHIIIEHVLHSTRVFDNMRNLTPRRMGCSKYVEYVIVRVPREPREMRILITIYICGVARAEHVERARHDAMRRKEALFL